MKFKIIESEISKYFEEELQVFCKGKKILKIDYKPICLAPDENAGWNTTLVFTALITYEEM